MSQDYSGISLKSFIPWNEETQSFDAKLDGVMKKRAKHLIDAMCQTLLESDLAFFNIFQSHIALNGQAVQPNVEFGELLLTVNSTVKQENVQVERIVHILSNGEQSLLGQSGKLSLPLFEFQYQNGSKDSQNRNRLITLAALSAYCVSNLANQGHDLALVKQKVLEQKLHVLRLSYSLPTDQVYQDYLTGKVLSNSTLQARLDGQATIHFNGSRQVQEDEKVAVAMSMKGIDIANPASVTSGYMSEKLTAADHFVFSSMNHLWNSGYYLKVAAGCGLVQYKLRYPKVVSDIVNLVLRCLWNHASNSQLGNYTLRYALGGNVGDSTPPSLESKTGNWKIKKISGANFDQKFFNTALNSVWQRRTAEEWETLTGQGYPYGDEELSLFEYATQLFFDNNPTSIFARQLSLSASKEGEKATSKFPKVGNAIVHLLDAMEEAGDHDLFSGVELFLGMNQFIVRGDEEETEELNSRLSDLIQTTEFDIGALEF